jgi:hypothetical protein
MKTNLILIGIGVSFILLGVYRACPLKIIGIGSWVITLSMPVCIVIFVLWALSIGGTPALVKGTEKSLQMTSLYLPLLLTFIPVMALGTVIATYYANFFHDVIGGRFGFIGAFLAGSISPTSNAFYGFVQEYWTKPELRAVLLYFLTVTPLLSYNMFIMRQMGLGDEIAIAMYKANALSALWLMPFFWAYGKLIR